VVPVILSDALLPALLGLGTGFTLIVAIGAQNAFLLRLGIAGDSRTLVPVVLICALSDAVLILAGIIGIGAVVERAPVVLVVIRVLGSGFLIVYGLLAAKRAFRPRALVASDAGQVPIKTAILTVIGLTWLNPHVYLDTVIFLGSIGNQQGDGERWWWAGGAMAASFLWFSLLGFGARVLRPFFARARSWRILDGGIAVVMLSLGLRMAIGG
jgi:L-lysine exporter family protein LysE/ArgO